MFIHRGCVAGYWLFASVAVCLVNTAIAALSAAAAEPAAAKALAEQVRTLDPEVLPESHREAASAMVRDDLRRRLAEANRRSSREWYKIKSRQDWEKFRDPRVEALRRSLGQFPPPKKLDARLTGTHQGEGFRIDNVLFESRTGHWVTANLYSPDNPAASMPGIILCHSHHRPKTHGELQDMGMTWARAGCLVLVPDHLGHGERRQHPFAKAADYDGQFAVSRQDYYFRYDTAMQLHLAGDSLVGWMAWDLMRGVDYLLSRPGIDPKRIVLLGAVAGGGDPAAVTAAVDERIAAVVPFNFGGPQPETRYPLPDDADTSFNYAGSGGWESTRNLRRSAGEGFLPWVIVGAAAPRGLIFGHEFAWDRPRDPVWKRLTKIYDLYDAADRLAYAHGRGELRGRPPEATHCTHIGRPHREMIHPTLKRWFGIHVGPDEKHREYSNRRDESTLLCTTDNFRDEIMPKALVDLLPALADERIAALQKRLAGKSPAEQRRLLRAAWSEALGPVTAKGPPKPADQESVATSGDLTVRRVTLDVEPGIFVPVMLISAKDADGRRPAVVMLAHAGRREFLRQRASEIAALVAGGATVCLPDVRATGDTRGGTDRGQYSAATGRSSSELMLAGTMVGAQLRDLRSVLTFLRGRKDLDPGRIALWGDSLAEVNPAGTKFRMPRRIDGRPRQSEPLGGMLAVLAGLYDEQIAAVYVRGGLTGFRDVLTSQFVLIPHDVVVPGAVPAGDLPTLAAALSPRPLRLAGLVDGLNRRVDPENARQTYGRATDSYRSTGSLDRLSFTDSEAKGAGWVLAALQE